jgi:hypothetical protein
MRERRGGGDDACRQPRTEGFGRPVVAYEVRRFAASDRVDSGHVAICLKPDGSTLHGQGGDPDDLLVQVGPALAAVAALEQRAVAQTGEELALSGRKRVDVGVERARERLPGAGALPAVDRRVGRAAPVRLERAGGRRDEPAVRVGRVDGQRPAVASPSGSPDTGVMPLWTRGVESPTWPRCMSYSAQAPTAGGAMDSTNGAPPPPSPSLICFHAAEPQSGAEPSLYAARRMRTRGSGARGLPLLRFRARGPRQAPRLPSPRAGGSV